MTNNEILEKIHLATDIILGINFTKKIIQIESENWTVIAKRNDLASLNPPPTQKTSFVEKAKEYNKLSEKDENILNRFMKILEAQLPLEPLQQIHYKKLRTEIMKQMIIPSSEFNKILNLAISQGLIEESANDVGHYKLVVKKQQ